MFNQTDLQDLLAYDAGEGKVLSLYLNTDAGQESREAIKLKVRNLLKEAGEKYAADASWVERYLDHDHDWSKRGLALFSCAKNDFFRVYPTAVSFRDRVRTQHKPYIKPLAHLLDFYSHYGVILIDRVGARFFDYHLGELCDTEGTFGEEIRKLKDGKGSSSLGMRGGQSGDRHETEAVQRNLREAAAAAATFFANRQIRRLFLGGTNETVAQFREMLPKQLQSCLASSFACDMDMGEHEVRDKTLALLQKTNMEREAKLVSSMVTAAAKGSTAVTGLKDTLHAAFEGRIQTLIFSDGYRAPGYRYKDSGYLSASLVIDTPEAAGEPIEVEDIVEAVATQTLSHGGHIEVISGNPELEEVGRIGAILRY